MAEKNYITPGGYKKLVEELTYLATVERPRVVREVSDAAAEGDRSENAAYIYGKRRLREIDRRMGFLTRRLRVIAVVDAREQRKDRVFFGAIVDVEDEDSGEELTLQIVGVDEIDVPGGRISWQSPIGRALLGKKVDDSVRVSWHAGSRVLTLTAIRYEEVAMPGQLHVPDLPTDVAEGLDEEHELPDPRAAAGFPPEREAGAEPKGRAGAKAAPRPEPKGRAAAKAAPRAKPKGRPAAKARPTVDPARVRRERARIR